MRGAVCKFNSATALRSVFLQTNTASFQGPRHFLPTIALPLQAPTRSFSYTRPAALVRHRPKKNIPLGKGNKDAAPDNSERKFARDENITSPFVFLRDEEGKLSGPLRTRELLSDLDLEVDTLLLVALARPASSNQTDEAHLKWPIVRVANRAELDLAEEEAAKRAEEERKYAKKTKELEINWAIAPHDLQTRLRQLSGFLEKGLRTQISLMPKRGRDKKKANMVEAAQVLAQVEEAIAAVGGCVPYKTREGKLGADLRLYYQGPKTWLKRKPVEAEDKTQDTDGTGQAEQPEAQASSS